MSVRNKHNKENTVTYSLNNIIMMNILLTEVNCHEEAGVLQAFVLREAGQTLGFHNPTAYPALRTKKVHLQYSNQYKSIKELLWADFS